MRLLPLIPCLLSVLLSSGCTYSVHPIVLESDQTTDIDLSGTWALKAESSERIDWNRFSVQSADDGANYVGAIDGGKSFTARIGKLGDDRYLQLSLHEQKPEERGLLPSVPIYLIARFEAVDDELRIFPVGHDNAFPWFDEHQTPHRLIDTGLKHCVLTDDTPTLQKLLKDHGDELFSKTGFTFTRKPVATNQDNESRQSGLQGGTKCPPPMKQVQELRKLEFLVGTWKSVDPENAPPAPETRTITMQPDGLSLTMTSESILGKGQPVHITYDVESQEYRLTHTDAEGEKRVFRAQLNDGSRLSIRHLEGKTGLFSDLTLIVTVTDDTWTDAFEQPNGKDPFVFHTFERQQTER